MTQNLNLTDEQYICDECGYTSPIANERCPDCGSAMTALHDEKPKTKVTAGDSEEDLGDEISDTADTADGSTSLEALADEEEKESQAEYNADTFGDQ